MRIADLQEGDSRTAVVVDGLTRTQLVMYAGASGDFNPLHTDEVYATQVAGYDSVIAHGQLTMGLTATVVTGWVDEADLGAFGVRFKNQVLPGDTLTVTATVVSVADSTHGPEAELALSTVNQSGVEVVTGYARLRSPWGTVR